MEQEVNPAMSVHINYDATMCLVSWVVHISVHSIHNKSIIQFNLVVHIPCLYNLYSPGLNFWKVGSRKFFAVMESSLAEPGSNSTKGKRKLKSLSTVRMVDDTDSTSGDNEEPRPKPKKKCCSIAKELEELKDQIRNIVEVKGSNAKVPIGLLIQSSQHSSALYAFL